MPKHPARPPDPALEAALRTGFDRTPDEGTARLAARVASAFGPAAACLVHYGSHVNRAQPAPESARDFFVIVDAYAPAYRALALAGVLRHPSWFAAGLNRILPPNVIGTCAERGVAKCAVLRWKDLESACSAHPRDHFVRARLFQQVEIAWARDAAARARVITAVAAARAGTFRWVRPFLPAAFGVADYCETMLWVSYAAEIRPEDQSRPGQVAAAQSGTLLRIYGALLDDLASRGVLARERSEYRDPRAPRAPGRAAARAFFAWSRLRATLRWAKYVILYEGWLDYVLRKIERRSGVHLELTPRERRWPLVFLWPRALRYLGRRSQRPS